MSGTGASPGLTPGRRLRGSVSRRSFLRGAGLAATAATLSACAVPGIKVSDYTAVPDLSDSDKTLNWSNWPFYIDVAEDGSTDPTTLELFVKKTGIQVAYTEDVNDNDEYFAKIQPQLTGGQEIAADLFVVTDWMVGKLIRLGFLTELDHANIPNLKNLRADLRDVSYDPGRKYSVTWQSGLAGIAVNPAALGGVEITSMDQLLTDSALRGKVTLLTEMRDTVGLTMMDLGYDCADFTFEQFDAAIAKLQKSVDSGQIRRFTGNDYGSDLAQGNVAACVGWTGDVVSLQADTPDLGFVVPDAGCTIWSDNFVAPIRSPRKKNAETLINFYYDPEIAAQSEDYINYITPVDGTAKVMEDYDPDLLENPLVFPDKKTLAKAQVFMGLTEEEENRCNRAFAKLTGA
ncbi:spermidine/putrescine ABC transporter substrate-binding protein [uncultured Friedmanniella sp.]|uniref:polyamine ABC transporter substrate-binding protein n=1 Tax=uncultured Friedmanniella sp. TaxID=335381 RepID=UPI0035CAC319